MDVLFKNTRNGVAVRVGIRIRVWKSSNKTEGTRVGIGITMSSYKNSKYWGWDWDYGVLL